MSGSASFNCVLPHPLMRLPMGCYCLTYTIVLGCYYIWQTCSVQTPYKIQVLQGKSILAVCHPVLLERLPVIHRITDAATPSSKHWLPSGHNPVMAAHTLTSSGAGVANHTNTSLYIRTTHTCLRRNCSVGSWGNLATESGTPS